jgi:anti-sigma factor (TIGR02949 family)
MTLPPLALLAAAPPCRAVAACVYELLDGELAPPLALALRDHLRACLHCRGLVAGERALLERVARAARVEPAPAPLVARVRAELAGRAATIDAGRDVAAPARRVRRRALSPRLR